VRLGRTALPVFWLLLTSRSAAADVPLPGTALGTFQLAPRRQPVRPQGRRGELRDAGQIAVGPSRGIGADGERPGSAVDLAYGEPGQLARLGLLAGDGAAKAVAYRAPRIRRPAREVASDGPRTTVFRVALDRTGTVRDVDVVIPSGLPAADAELGRELMTDRYAPATLDGRPIAASVFIELLH
jgi:hypothetical protein